MIVEGRGAAEHGGGERHRSNGHRRVHRRNRVRQPDREIRYVYFS